MSLTVFPTDCPGSVSLMIPFPNRTPTLTVCSPSIQRISVGPTNVTADPSVPIKSNWARYSGLQTTVLLRLTTDSGANNVQFDLPARTPTSDLSETNFAIGAPFSPGSASGETVSDAFTTGSTALGTPSGSDAMTSSGISGRQRRPFRIFDHDLCRGRRLRIITTP